MQCVATNRHINAGDETKSSTIATMMYSQSAKRQCNGDACRSSMMAACRKSKTQKENTKYHVREWSPAREQVDRHTKILQVVREDEEDPTTIL
jgi:hypothetical protein